MTDDNQASTSSCRSRALTASRSANSRSGDLGSRSSPSTSSVSSDRVCAFFTSDNLSAAACKDSQAAPTPNPAPAPGPSPSPTPSASATELERLKAENQRLQDEIAGNYIEQVVVHCDIANEDKEREGSFKFEVKKGGEVIASATGWGLGATWKDGEPHQMSAGGLAKKKMSRKGAYELNIEIDNGKSIDVACNWYVDVIAANGTKVTSPVSSYFFRNQVRTLNHSWSFTE